MLKTKGHDCELFIDALEKELVDKGVSYQPNVLEFSVITGSHQWVLKVVRQIREKLLKVFVVLGGSHSTYCPDVVKEPVVDTAVRGESELTIVDLVNG